MDSGQLLLVFSAIAIGWLLGRISVRGKDQDSTTHSEYYKGLNYLLNDRSDGALDAFISSLEVNSDTLETHITVGNLMRRKGEVEKAIRIHQNLLSRPSLAVKHLHQAHLELARDYISAGLLDRAERLLEDLLREAPELRDVARRHLLEIYQDEREWQKAIDAAKRLLPKKSLLKSSKMYDSGLAVTLSHYCCEMAELSSKANDYHSARKHLKMALSYDSNCVRASLLSADIDYRTEHYSRAIRSLRRVKDQNIHFVPETVELVKSTYGKLGEKLGFYNHFIECQKMRPSATVLLALVEDIQAREGDVAAAQFIGSELQQRPSLRGLSKLVELHVGNSHGRARENLSILQLLIAQLTQNKVQYQCRHCGFSTIKIHWLCHGCKQWGQIAQIRGVEGD